MKTAIVTVLGSCALSSLLACGGTGNVEQPYYPAPDTGTGTTPEAGTQDVQGPVESGVALPPSVHSASFFPVQGVLDNGQPAGELLWDYRVDHGQPHVDGTNPNLTFTFQDEIQTVEQSTLKQTVTAAVSGSATGTTSDVFTEQIDPATSGVMSTTNDSSATLDTGSATVDLAYTWTPPLPGYFDRNDLDTLAIGTSDSSTVTPAITDTVTNASGTQNITGTGSVTSSWSLVDKLPSYAVLGVTYTDVVKVQQTVVANLQLTSSTGQSGSSTATTTTTSWLARGIGVIYAESTTQQQNGTDNTVLELVATNLVPGAVGDAGVDGAVSDGGTVVEAGADAASE
jgi:hypothetical protein